jgi:hypothetical protein
MRRRFGLSRARLEKIRPGVAARSRVPIALDVPSRAGLPMGANKMRARVLETQNDNEFGYRNR